VASEKGPSKGKEVFAKGLQYNTIRIRRVSLLSLDKDIWGKRNRIYEKKKQGGFTDVSTDRPQLYEAAKEVTKSPGLRVQDVAR